MEAKTYTFFIQGMHCRACELVTKCELEEQSNITSATSNLATRSVEIVGDFGDKSQEQIAEELTAILSRNGYSVSTTPTEEKVRWNEFTIALPIAVGFMFLFILLQKLGIVNLVNTAEVTYGTALVIGIIASLSTCMAVVGGLVLSVSATFAREGDKLRPQIIFHAGRIVSFFVLGGVIGALGAAFQLGTTGTFVLSIIVGIVMLVLGINLLDVFHWAKRFQPSMPKSLSRRVLGVTKFNHSLTPALVGIVTFFLPCGFTQSMQVYTLSTGNFLKGGLTMLAFALGTLPVLALVSFSSFSVTKSSNAGLFFKTAGLIVIMFAIFNILNSLVAVGWLPPIFNF